MLKKRLIPVLLIKGGRLVRARRFCEHYPTGVPAHQVGRYVDWNLDELVCLDIGGGRTPAEVGRLVSEIAAHCRMPLTFGGGIASVEDMQLRLRSGADKVAITTHAATDPGLIERGAHEFGSQAIVVGIDARKTEGGYEVVIDGGRRGTGMTPEAWARRVQELGAGEILLHAVDRDGTGEGYDIGLIERVAAATSLPLIVCGGADGPADFAAALRLPGVSAAAAGNWFLFKELSYPKAKTRLSGEGLPVR